MLSALKFLLRALFLPRDHIYVRNGTILHFSGRVSYPCTYEVESEE